MTAIIEGPDPVTRFAAGDLAHLIPGTARRTWLREYIPHLVAVGVLHKRGRAWFGRRSEIEAALLGRLPPPSSPAASTPSKRTQGRGVRSAA